MSRCEGPWWAPCGCQTIWQRVILCNELQSLCSWIWKKTIRNKCDVQALVKRIGGFGVKSVSITSDWPSSLVSKGYEFAASCACPGSSHHTGRLGLLGTEARRHRKFSENTHQGQYEPAAGKTPDSAIATMVQRWPSLASWRLRSSLLWPMLLCCFFLPSRWCYFLSPSQSNICITHTHTHLLKKMPLKLAR